MFFLFRFPTLNASHLTPFVYVSILPSHWFFDIKQNTIIASFYNTEGAKADVPLNKKGAAPC